MQAIRQYLISVTAAAIICGIVSSLMGHSKTHASIVKLISGIFLTLTVLSPLTKIEIGSLAVYSDVIVNDAQDAVERGKTSAQSQLEQIIITQTQTYIQDKAESLGIEISASVNLTDAEIPKPDSVTIYGDVSPYHKNILQIYIAQNLDIPKEKQHWI